VIIVAALVALVQMNAMRTGGESPITTVGLSLGSFIETAVSATVSGVRGAGTAVISLPQLERNNAALRDENARLAKENVQLNELNAAYAADTGIRPIVDTNPKGIEARVVGFPPENESRTVTIDRGSSSGIHKDDGVLAAGGVVGRIESVTPFASKVVLITDYTSRLPAVTRRGRWWGIARGNIGSVRVEYIPQDAPLKIGDVIVTGEGRSFHSGVPLGTIAQIERGDATLYQTAILKPAANIGALDRVVVVPK
jgi:rod shape-determining protein MreC